MFLLRKPYFDRKTRLIYAAGNLCLFTGTALTLFDSRWGVHHRILLDGFRGFFLGFSITLLLWVARRKWSCAPPQDGSV